MAEENIEVSAGCSHERLQFGHALPHLFFFFLDSQNFGSVGSVKREIKLVWPKFLTLDEILDVNVMQIKWQMLSTLLTHVFTSSEIFTVYLQHLANMT